MASPDSVLRGLSRGMFVLGSLAAVVADDLVNLDDDVLGNLGIYGITIDHLNKSYALFIILCRGYLAEYFEIFGYNYTDEITGYVLLLY